MNINAHILYPQPTKPTVLDHIALHIDVIVIAAVVVFAVVVKVVS